MKGTPKRKTTTKDNRPPVKQKVVKKVDKDRSKKSTLGVMSVILGMGGLLAKMFASKAYNEYPIHPGLVPSKEQIKRRKELAQIRREARLDRNLYWIRNCNTINWA